MIELAKIYQAYHRLKDTVVNTPFSYAPHLSKLCHANIYLKKENLQNTGSFKIRGAFNKIASLSEGERQQGVIAASAGNHAQGVAFSGAHFGIKAVIVMPENTPLLKVSGCKALGAEVILHGNNYDEAYAYAKEYGEKNKLVFVHPFADDEVIAGQGSIALEMYEENKELDIIICPIGGGGLISGVASAYKQLNPKIKIIGVTAKGAPAMKNSFVQKSATHTRSVRTIADGIAVRDTNKLTLGYILESVDEIVEVEDEEIANAILFLLERQKLVVEGAGAVGVAAIMHEKIPEIGGKNVGVLLSGGNIDVTMLSVIIEKGLIKSHRKMRLNVTLIDKPGSLRGLTDIFTEAGANIVQIGYDRTSASLEYGDANVLIALETKGSEHQAIIKSALKTHGYKYVELD